MRVVVVGAGIAGASCGTRLAAAGHEVVVLDKAARAGGRMATRRVGAGTFDTGAQFFTTRSPGFVAEVGGWLADGRARVWCHGFAGREDGHPRHVGAEGMARLCRSLSEGLDVRGGVRVGAVARRGDGWEVAADELAEPLAADAVVLTPPVPQVRALVPAALDVPEVAYDPCLAVLAVVEGRHGVPDPGGLQLDGGPFGFVADNGAKGTSAVPALTLHAAPDLSAARLDDDAGDVVRDLLAEARPHLGGAEVVEAQLKRWRHARPVDGLDGGCLELAPGLVLAGDAFHGAKVEGAWRSGADAADLLLARA